MAVRWINKLSLKKHKLDQTAKPNLAAAGSELIIFSEGDSSIITKAAYYFALVYCWNRLYA